MHQVYYEAIRYRRWNELEEYAKRRPDQLLADTVSALAESIGEKPDEKALRKILFLLAQKGITPNSGEIKKPKPQRSSLVGFACLRSPNKHGCVEIMVGVQNGRKGEVIVFTTQPFYHFCRVDSTYTVPFANLKDLKQNFLRRCDDSIVSVVELDFARGRLGCCIDRHSPRVHEGIRYEVPAFWKPIFEGVNWNCHPTLEMARPKISRTRALELCNTVPELGSARILLRPNNPMTDEIHALGWRTDLTGDRKKAEALELFRGHPELFWSEYVTHDLNLRLLDLALHYHLRGDARGVELLAIADDLLKRKSASVYGAYFEELVAGDIDSTLMPDDDFAVAA